MWYCSHLMVGAEQCVVFIYDAMFRLTFLELLYFNNILFHLLFIIFSYLLNFVWSHNFYFIRVYNYSKLHYTLK